ncbi:exodeoxyribonuclease V subunit beta [Buchnera aphidicola]|uniref:exodeoxyribonuclease V subunit beta n=1 Tax=Buchnera aphidicola TaxID=9 RepID=UPI0034644CD1
MKIIQEKKLNVFKISLIGVKLIEASAGTGKTLTIVLLYLRFLLGLGYKKNYVKPLLVRQILILTFTNAAKEELRTRIYKYLNDLYVSCIQKKSDNPVLKLFLKKISNMDEAIYLLKQAQNHLDQSAIYTIHEFCQKMLELNTFHFNSIFHKKIVEHEDDLYLQATEDFWRYYFYPLKNDIVKNILKEYSEPKVLFKKIKPLLKISLINIQHDFKKNDTLTIYYNKIIQKINNFKKKWLLYHSNILSIIQMLKINKRVYNQYNITRWVNIITLWANKKTDDFYIPNSLKYFTKISIEQYANNDIVKPYFFFEEIKYILNKNFSLKNIIIFYALRNIPKFLKKNKDQQSCLNFDDLLTLLLKNIKQNNFISEFIRNTYPAAFIDEFQDTNIQQYKIFDLVYKKNNSIALFFIGDPKQAIYSFRGADIFSYLYAKKHIKKQYYLDINWRSSVNMCNSINALFSHHKNPFLFKNIKFTPIIPSNQNIEMNFKIKGKVQTALHVFFQPKEEVSPEDYQIWIAKQCAYEINYWLICANIGDATISIHQKEKVLEKTDICILVRNTQEALLIQHELKNINIPSVYSSNKKNVFNTLDASALLIILKAILNPTNKILLYQLSITHIFSQIFFQNTDKKKYQIIQKLYSYYHIWEEKGIFCMIKKIVLDYQENTSFIELNKNYKKNINFLHLGELLEERFKHTIKITHLVRWFENEIFNRNNNSNFEKIKISHTLKNAIQITTIHKSKGLEYPITWIPFGVQFRPANIALFHRKKNKKIIFDLESKNESFKLADKERLSEDIRFLYVALTRSILHCSVGIASIIKKKSKKINYYSETHKTALGYIVQNGRKMHYKTLNTQLKKLSALNYIKLNSTIIKSKVSIIHKQNKNVIRSNPYNKKLHNIWSITSYTQLYQENLLYKYNFKKICTKKVFSSNPKKNTTLLNTYNFPRGKKTGILIHDILKEINFTKTIDYTWFYKKVEKYNIHKKWLLILYNWINNIIHTPFTENNIILSDLKKKNYIQELEFFLPIKKKISSKSLNNILPLVNSIDNISKPLFFNSFSGFIKGFIDLLFMWNKKYYILDYKSNWLGNNNSEYSQENIKKEIIKHRYDLQYHIYATAAHQYLKQKIKKYHYDTHFGGILYIFLRAIDNKNKKNGIFYILPKYHVIKKIISLF